MSDPTFGAAEIERLRERLANKAAIFLSSPEGVAKVATAIGLAIVACHKDGEVELGNALIDLFVLRGREKQAVAVIALSSLVAGLDLPAKPLITDPSRN